jgi:phenylpyruvate tautomerase PptA (4-oxalocrotonate tautomerase family)
MPIVQFTAFEHRLHDEQQAAALIQRLTDAVRETYGEDAARDTQVILAGVPPRLWGLAGKPAG